MSKKVYKIIDRQIYGREFADGAVFLCKEEIRKQLCDYHSIDYNGVNEDDSEKDIFSLSLQDILEYGEWEIEEVKPEIYQYRIDKKHKDSFWYYGLIARFGEYKLYAVGDIRVSFPDDPNTQHRDYHAVQEAVRRKYTDNDLAKCEWHNNNWFEIVPDEHCYPAYENFNGLIDGDYDSAMKSLLSIYEEQKENKEKDRACM